MRSFSAHCASDDDTVVFWMPGGCDADRPSPTDDSGSCTANAMGCAASAARCRAAAETSRSALKPSPVLSSSLRDRRATIGSAAGSWVAP